MKRHYGGSVGGSMGGQTCVMSIKVDLNLLINNTKYESIITEIHSVTLLSPKRLS